MDGGFRPPMHSGSVCRCVSRHPVRRGTPPPVPAHRRRSPQAAGTETHRPASRRTATGLKNTGVGVRIQQILLLARDRRSGPGGDGARQFRPALNFPRLRAYDFKERFGGPPAATPGNTIMAAGTRTPFFVNARGLIGLLALGPAAPRPPRGPSGHRRRCPGGVDRAGRYRRTPPRWRGGPISATPAWMTSCSRRSGRTTTCRRPRPDSTRPWPTPVSPAPTSSPRCRSA